MTEFHIFAIVLTVLQAVDGWTTYQVLKMGGSESNPLVSRLMSKVGVYPALVVYKGAAAALSWALALMPIAHPDHYLIRLGAMLGLTALYVWVAFNNWCVLQGIKDGNG